MDEDKILQTVNVSGNAQTGDITLIGKIVNVIQVIKQPALWQDAVWGFLIRNWVFVLTCLFVQAAFLAIFLRYRNLFLLPVLPLLVVEILIIFVLWSVNLVVHRKITKTSLIVSGSGFLALLITVGWVSVPVIHPRTIPANKFGIAIATFGEGANYSPSNQAREISDQVYNGLCEELRQNLASANQTEPCDVSGGSNSPILVQKIGVVADKDTAAWYGHRIGADVTIWGQVLSTGRGSTTIRFQVDETLDKAVTPQFQVVMPVTADFTEVIIREQDYGSDPLAVKKAIAGQTAYLSSFALGLFNYLQRDFPKAVNYLEKAREIADHSRASQACIQAADQSGLNCKSLALLYLYLGRSYNGQGLLSQGQKDLFSARALNPNEPATLISLAIGYANLGQTDERDKYLKEATDAIQGWLSSHSDHMDAALYDRGVIDQILEDYDSAVEDFEAVIKGNPTYYVAYLNLANLYSEQGKYPQAVDTLNQAIQLSKYAHGNPASAHLSLAIVLDKMGNSTGARQEYLRAIQADPDFSEVYASFGKFLEDQKEIPDAHVAFQNLAKATKDPGWAYGTLAAFELRNGFFQEAASDFNTAIYWKGEDPLLHTGLALAYARLGNTQGAETEFEKALQLPGAGDYTVGEYAGFLAGQHKFVEAVEMYERALKLSPENALILLNLGYTYQEMKEPEKAIAIYRHIVRSPDYFSWQDRESAQQRLHALGALP